VFTGIFTFLVSGFFGRDGKGRLTALIRLMPIHCMLPAPWLPTRSSVEHSQVRLAAHVRPSDTYSYCPAATPLLGNQMYSGLGYQWATSLLAFLTLAMAPFPFLFFFYGKRIRNRSRFAKH
jgi:hypothetical protein